MCCWILEIALVIMGILALVKGEVMLTRKRVVRGAAARLIGALIAAPAPLGFGAMIAGVAIDVATSGQPHGTWTNVGVAGYIAMHVIGLASAVVIAIAKHDRPGVLAEMPAYPGFAPPVHAPPADPNNPYASPFGGDQSRPPG